jgi:hypothetical protein
MSFLDSEEEDQDWEGFEYDFVGERDGDSAFGASESEADAGDDDEAEEGADADDAEEEKEYPERTDSDFASEAEYRAWLDAAEQEDDRLDALYEDEDEEEEEAEADEEEEEEEFEEEEAELLGTIHPHHPLDVTDSPAEQATSPSDQAVAPTGDVTSEDSGAPTPDLVLQTDASTQALSAAPSKRSAEDAFGEDEEVVASKHARH